MTKIIKEKLEKHGEHFVRDFLLLKGCIVHLVENKAGGRGCPDLLLVKDGIVFLFEMKQESTIKDLRPSQKATLLAYNGCTLAHCSNGKVLEYYPHCDSFVSYINLEQWYLTLSATKWGAK